MTKGKGQNPSTERKTVECNPWKATGSCSEGESCSFLHKPLKVEKARGSGIKPSNERVRECNEQTSSAVPQVRARTDVKRSTSLEARPATRANTPCAWRANFERASCDFRHPPVCRSYKSEHRCSYGNRCLFRHADGAREAHQEVEEIEFSMSSCDSQT